MKIICITGASGFFGESLVNELLNSEQNFKCFLIYRSNFFQVSDSRFQWVQCDLLNAEAAKHLISDIKPTHLVHLAWYVHPQKFWTAIENIDWLFYSVNLFNVFCENGGKVFIGAGTLSEYDWTSGILDEKNTPLIPNSIYGQCKKSLYELLIRLRDTNFRNTKIFWPRIGYFFGEHEPEEKLISKLINSIKKGVPVNLPSPDFQRPYAHIKYFGKSIIRLLMVDNIKGCTFNVSASVSYRILDIVELISTQLEKKPTIHYGAYEAKPETLDVKSDVFMEKMGFNIPDTFFEDLKDLVEMQNEKF